jgi:hypothetical protein
MKTFAVEVEYLEAMPPMYYRQRVDLLVAAETEETARVNLKEAYKEAPQFAILSLKDEGEASPEIVELMKKQSEDKGKLN